MQDLARTMTRTLITSTLEVTRWPMDAATRLIPGGDDGSKRIVVSLLDRADGAVRQALGGVLRDPLLEADGRRRLVARQERLRATQLRTEAEEVRDEADERVVQRIETAEERREAVRQQADEQQAEAEQLREERLAAQRQAKAVRAAEVAERKRAELAKVDKAEKRARLDVLDDQAGALDAQSDALVVTDEAERLATAAAKAKAARTAR